MLLELARLILELRGGDVESSLIKASLAFLPLDEGSIR